MDEAEEEDFNEDTIGFRLAINEEADSKASRPKNRQTMQIEMKSAVNVDQ